MSTTGRPVGPAQPPFDRGGGPMGRPPMPPRPVLRPRPACRLPATCHRRGGYRRLPHGNASRADRHRDDGRAGPNSAMRRWCLGRGEWRSRHWSAESPASFASFCSPPSSARRCPAPSRWPTSCPTSWRRWCSRRPSRRSSSRCSPAQSATIPTAGRRSSAASSRWPPCFCWSRRWCRWRRRHCWSG